MSEKRPVSPVNGQPLPRGRPFEPGEEQREKSRRAGKRSGEIRAARKTLREELLQLLTIDITSKDGKVMQTQAALSAALIKQALNGNTKAYEIIRDTIGEKPMERVEVTTPDMKALDDAFRSAGGDRD